MKRSEKYNSVNPQVQTRSSLSSSIRVGLAALALPIILSACVTESQFLAQNAPSALNTALARGRFELNCPQASGTVLSQKVTYINGMGIGMGGGGGYEWTEYTIGVRGCGKSAVYETMCRDPDNCNSFANTGQIIQNQQ
ncbi:MAG TPA: hypothetical protein VLS45_05860 [Methylomicrobium sp.]|jgi:hypothetical protein|nr:hypothetical protein [Methylomicrobium sp.]